MEYVYFDFPRLADYVQIYYCSVLESYTSLNAMAKSVLCLISYFCMIVCTSVIIYLFCNVLQFKPIWDLSIFLNKLF